MKSDSQLQQDVLTELRWEFGFDVTQEWATLQGQVATCSEPRDATCATQRVAA